VRRTPTSLVAITHLVTKEVLGLSTRVVQPSLTATLYGRVGDLLLPGPNERRGGRAAVPPGRRPAVDERWLPRLLHRHPIRTRINQRDSWRHEAGGAG